MRGEFGGIEVNQGSGDRTDWA